MVKNTFRIGGGFRKKRAAAPRRKQKSDSFGRLEAKKGSTDDHK